MINVLLYPSYFIAGYTALVLALYMLSNVVSKAAFAARGLAALLSLIICALYGIGACIVMRLVGQEQSAQWATGRAFKYIMGITTGIEFVVEDPDHVLDTVRPAVFIGNHQTELDVLMLGTMFPKHCSVTAKASLKRTPFLGWFMSATGAVFIDRKNSRDARDAMAGAARTMTEKRQSVYMFPEGTRSYTKEPTLLDFKKGAFHLAVQSEVPIVPVVVANYSHILYHKDFVFKSGKVPVKVLEPIATKGLTSADVEELTRTVRENMLKEINALTQKARGSPMAVPAASTEQQTNGGAIRATGVDAS